MSARYDRERHLLFVQARFRPTSYSLFCNEGFTLAKSKATTGVKSKRLHGDLRILEQCLDQWSYRSEFWTRDSHWQFVKASPATLRYTKKRMVQFYKANTIVGLVRLMQHSVLEQDDAVAQLCGILCSRFTASLAIRIRSDLAINQSPLDCRVLFIE